MTDKKDDEPEPDSDEPIDYEELLEEIGPSGLRAMLRDDPDNAELAAFIDENDTSCSNEDLGRDEDGNREDE